MPLFNQYLRYFQTLLFHKPHAFDIAAAGVIVKKGIHFCGGCVQLPGKSIGQFPGFQQGPEMIEKRGQRGQLRLNPAGDQRVFNGFDDNPLKRGGSAVV